MLNVGQKNQRVALSFEPAKQGPAPKLDPGPEPESSGPKVHPLVWVFGAVGVAAGGALIYFGVTALNEEAALEEECGVTRVCTQDDIDTWFAQPTQHTVDASRLCVKRKLREAIPHQWIQI